MNEAWTLLGQHFLVAKTPFFKRARFEIFHHHIRIDEQF